jgi:hypothetical protein
MYPPARLHRNENFVALSIVEPSYHRQRLWPPRAAEFPHKVKNQRRYILRRALFQVSQYPKYTVAPFLKMSAMICRGRRLWLSD